MQDDCSSEGRSRASLRAKSFDSGKQGWPKEDRAFREEVLAKIPASYSPAFHLVFPSVIGIALAAFGIWLVHAPTWLELLIVPFLYVVSNATEWRMHKHVLHQRTRVLDRIGMSILYERHTPIHHRLFRADDMSIRSSREFAMVLIPPYGILLVALAVAPIAALLFFLGHPNLGGLFLATTMLYTVSYEWLHLSYHLPPETFVGRMWLVRVLKRHHATHHDPHLMQKWNFNVTVPLWDLVRGTVYREPQLDSSESHSRTR